MGAGARQTPLYPKDTLLPVELWWPNLWQRILVSESSCHKIDLCPYGKFHVTESMPDEAGNLSWEHQETRLCPSAAP